MKRLTAPAVTTTLLLNLGPVLFASGAVAQTPQEQIVGAWALVAADSVRPTAAGLRYLVPIPRAS